MNWTGLPAIQGSVRVRVGRFEREKGLESSRLSRPERLEGTAFLVAATAAGCIFL